MDSVVDIKIEVDKFPTGKEDQLSYDTNGYKITVVRGSDDEKLPGYTWFGHSVAKREIWNNGMTALCNIFCHDQDTGVAEVFDHYTNTYVYYQTNNYPRGPLLLKFVPSVDEESFDNHEPCLTNKENALSDARREHYYCKNEDKRWIGYRMKDVERIATRDLYRVLESISEKGYFRLEDHPDINMVFYDNSGYLRRIERYRKEQNKLNNESVEATGTDIKYVSISHTENHDTSDKVWKIGLGVVMILVALGAVFYSMVNMRAIKILNRY